MNTPSARDLENGDLTGDYARPAAPAHAAPSYDPRPDFPTAPRLGWLSRLRYDVENYGMQKGVQTAYLKAQQRAYEAALQGTVIAPALDAWGAYDSPGGVREPTGQTFSLLRSFAHRCEPVAAIHNKRIEQMAAFCRPAESRWGRQMSPGFRLRMTRRGSSPTAADKAEMETLTQFFAEGGFCAPPAEERPEGWQPGFEPFMRASARDLLTLDWIGVRTWKSAKDPKKYPVVAFAAVDAALIRNKRRVVETLAGGVPRYVPQDNERQNLPPATKRETQITHVLMDSDQGGREVEEYTDEDLFTAFMRPRTDKNANGYGYSVLEQLITAMTVWCAARDMNALRFDRDSAPRGILTIFGNMNPQQFNKFVLDWKSMMTGIKNRHTIPLLQGNPVVGSSVKYDPLDPTPRDMEYSQFTFAVGLWCHCLYGIHPDETGFSASSPFRPPLSEASPEDNLKYSQDTGLSPLLRFYENLLNRHILWRMYPGREYTFEFCGLGDYNALDDINTKMAALNAGIITPEMVWAEWDVDIKDPWKSHPAASFPMPFAQGVQLLMTMQQGQQQEAQANQPPQPGEPGQPPGEPQDEQAQGAAGDHDNDQADNDQSGKGQELEENKQAEQQNSVDKPGAKGYNASGTKQSTAPGFLKSVDVDGMQKAIDSAAANQAGVQALVVARRARRLGTIIVRR